MCKQGGRCRGLAGCRGWGLRKVAVNSPWAAPSLPSALPRHGSCLPHPVHPRGRLEPGWSAVDRPSGRGRLSTHVLGRVEHISSLPTAPLSGPFVKRRSGSSPCGVCRPGGPRPQGAASLRAAWRLLLVSCPPGCLQARLHPRSPRSPGPVPWGPAHGGGGAVVSVETQGWPECRDQGRNPWRRLLVCCLEDRSRGDGPVVRSTLGPGDTQTLCWTPAP